MATFFTTYTIPAKTPTVVDHDYTTAIMNMFGLESMSGLARSVGFTIEPIDDETHLVRWGGRAIHTIPLSTAHIAAARNGSIRPTTYEAVSIMLAREHTAAATTYVKREVKESKRAQRAATRGE